MKTFLAAAAALLAMASAAFAAAPDYSPEARMAPLTAEMAAPGAEGIGYLAKRCAAVNALFAALALNEEGQKDLAPGFVAQRDRFISLAVRDLPAGDDGQAAEDEVARMAEGYVYRVTDNRLATGKPMDDQIVGDLLLCQSLLGLAPGL